LLIAFRVVPGGIHFPSGFFTHNGFGTVYPHKNLDPHQEPSFKYHKYLAIKIAPDGIMVSPDRAPFAHWFDFHPIQQHNSKKRIIGLS
jgi:hypothetical protein